MTAHRTTLEIRGEDFFLDGRPTYPGRVWRGHRIEGLLLNSRMVQATFDDLNPETRPMWAYRDTGVWDAERNVREFLAAMPEWRRHGLLGITVNLQGGSPQGYSQEQPWHNSAFTAEGGLRPEFMDRLRRVLDLADRLGMAAIVGLFYFGQDNRLADEAAVRRATREAVDWLHEGGWRNVMVEIANECDIGRYRHPILAPERIVELLRFVRGRTREGRALPVATSYRGGSIPGDEVLRASDFALLHGNRVEDPARIAAMVDETRARAGWRPMPVLFNEDDHFDFDRPTNNFFAAIGRRCSWGYFDPYADGYQSPPVDWSIGTERKRAFFGLVREMAGV